MATNFNNALEMFVKMENLILGNVSWFSVNFLFRVNDFDRTLNPGGSQHAGLLD
jgi:hypothetical protein